MSKSKMRLIVLVKKIVFGLINYRNSITLKYTIVGRYNIVSYVKTEKKKPKIISSKNDTCPSDRRYT